MKNPTKRQIAMALIEAVKEPFCGDCPLCNLAPGCEHCEIIIGMSCNCFAFVPPGYSGHVRGEDLFYGGSISPKAKAEYLLALRQWAVKRAKEIYPRLNVQKAKKELGVE